MALKDWDWDWVPEVVLYTVVGLIVWWLFDLNIFPYL